MRIISNIEDPSVIRAILGGEGADLKSVPRLVRSRPPPKIHASPVCVHNTGRPTPSYITDEHSQLPPNYHFRSNMRVKHEYYLLLIASLTDVSTLSLPLKYAGKRISL
jgi:hypothetical protein